MYLSSTGDSTNSCVPTMLTLAMVDQPMDIHLPQIRSVGSLPGIFQDGSEGESPGSLHSADSRVVKARGTWLLGFAPRGGVGL